MTIPARIASELGLLTQALDASGSDIAATLADLDTAAHLAVDSCLGLRLAIGPRPTGWTLTLLDSGVQPDDVHTSLLVPLTAAEAAPDLPEIALILYAGTPGAFVDLAADLCWIIGCAPELLQIDQHIDVPSDLNAETALSTNSAINQALGVLIGRGLTPSQAERNLHQRAVAAGSPQKAADMILNSTLHSPALDPPA